MTMFDPGIQPNSRSPASKCSCCRKASSGGDLPGERTPTRGTISRMLPGSLAEAHHAPDKTKGPRPSRCSGTNAARVRISCARYRAGGGGGRVPAGGGGASFADGDLAGGGAGEDWVFAAAVGHL